MTIPLSRYSAASIVQAAPPVSSAFARRVCDTLQHVGALQAEESLWSAVDILRRPYGEVHTLFRHDGDGLLDVAARFHHTLFNGLELHEIPPGIHAFFRETFFSELVDGERFDFYFNELASALEAEISADSEEKPLSQPESATRSIRYGGLSDSTPTVADPSMMALEHKPLSSQDIGKVSDTMPAPPAWHDTDEPRESGTMDHFAVNVMGALISCGMLKAGDPVADAVKILNNETHTLYHYFVRPGVGHAEVADQFNRMITSRLEFEAIPRGLHNFFQDFYFDDWTDQTKFDSYFAFLAAILDECISESGSPTIEVSERPISGIWEKTSEPEADEMPATLRSPTVTTQNS